MYMNEENVWLSPRTLCKSGHSTRVHAMQKITCLHQSSTKQPIFPTETISDVRSYLTLLRLLVSLTPNPAHQRMNIHRPQGASSIKRQGRCCVAPSFRYLFTPSFRMNCCFVLTQSSSSNNS